MMETNLDKKLTIDVVKRDGKELKVQDFYSEIFTDKEDNLLYYILSDNEGQNLNDLDEDNFPKDKYINVFKCKRIGSNFLVIVNKKPFKIQINRLVKLKSVVIGFFTLYSYFGKDNL